MNRAAMSGARPRAPWQALLAGAAAVLAGGCADAGEVVPPRQLGENPVEYPIDLWDQGEEGEALLRVLVTETGGVDSVEVVQSAGHPTFDSAAVAGARQMRFTPARRD
jgi:TonB family protein